MIVNCKALTHVRSLYLVQLKSDLFIFLSVLLQNFFMCRDRCNGDMRPTLDTALLCSSRADSDLGHESGLGW